MSGLHVVIAQISSLTPPLYLICILAASRCCSLGSVGSTVALNFLIQLSSVGSGFGQFSLRGTFEPSCKICLAKTVDVGMTINFDVVFGLGDIDAIEHTKKNLAFKGNRKLIIYHFQECVCSLLIRSHNGKVVYLVFEYNLIASNSIQVKTRLMDYRRRSKFVEDGIYVFLPQPG
jgi:hypothetical protein